MKTRLLVAVTMAALSWSALARAGSLDAFGASSRGTAMGGAMVAIADGWEAVQYNPSALALSRNSTSVQASFLLGSAMINTTDQITDGPSFKLGVNQRLLRNRLGVGLIVGYAGGSGSGLSLDLGSLTGGGGPPNWNWQMYQNGLPVVFAAGFGFRIADWLAVGLNLNQKDSLVSLGAYPLVVDPILESLIGINTGALPSNVEGMGTSIGTDPADSFATGFNISFRPLPYVSLGYMYKPEAWSRYKLRVELVGGVGGLLPESQYILIDMKVPGQVETTVYGGAVNIPIAPNQGTLTLAFSHEQQNWDGFYPRSTQYQWDARDTFHNPWFSEKITKDPGLDDIAINRYGVEYTGDASFMMLGWLQNLGNPRFSVRAGYYQRATPQPDVDYGWQLAMVDSDAKTYSLGLGFGFDRQVTQKTVGGELQPRRIEIDLHLQQTNMEDRDYKIGADEWGNAPSSSYWVKTSGSITNLGFQITWLR